MQGKGPSFSNTCPCHCLCLCHVSSTCLCHHDGSCLDVCCLCCCPYHGKSPVVAVPACSCGCHCGQSCASAVPCYVKKFCYSSWCCGFFSFCCQSPDHKHGCCGSFCHRPCVCHAHAAWRSHVSWIWDNPAPCCRVHLCGNQFDGSCPAERAATQSSDRALGARDFCDGCWQPCWATLDQHLDGVCCFCLLCWQTC